MQLLKIKNAYYLAGFTVLAWASWTSFCYFFDVTPPTLMLQGLKGGTYCGGDIQCLIQGRDSYKVNKLSVWLDEKPFVSNFKVNKKEFEHPLPIDTRRMPNGKHTLKVEVQDGTFKRNKSVEEVTFFVDNTPIRAAFVRPETDFKVLQGRTLHIQFQVNKPIKEATISLLSNKFQCFPETANSSVWEAFVPIDCEEAANEYPMSVEVEDHTGSSTTLDSKFQVMPYPFKKMGININSNKVAEEEEIGRPQSEFENLMEELYPQSLKQKLWQGTFYVPLDMTRVTCDYGVKRTSQQKGSYMHKALDIVAAAPKSVVWAPQDGNIIIKDRFVETGNTIVIDHGWGVFTMLCHLDSFTNVNVGDKIKRGNPVGTMGKTGYATGYHLHWEMRINNIPVDPMQWTKGDF